MSWSDAVIDEHAFKHGLEADDIACAWTNYVRKRYRAAPNEGQVVLVGFDRGGRLIEVIAAEKGFGYVIYHAMEPPTRNVLVELGLIRRTR